MHFENRPFIYEFLLKNSQKKLYYFLYRDREKWIPIEHGVGPVLAINGLDDQYVLLFIQIIYRIIYFLFSFHTELPKKEVTVELLPHWFS